MEDKMIEIKNLSKTYNYKKTNAFQALKNVSLTIEDGEMIAIMGKSGAGKSTLMHIIGCIDDFEAGEYLLNGKSIHKIGERKQAEIRNKEVGIVMQDFALIEGYTVLENVMIPLYFCKAKKKKEKAMEALAKIGIDDLAHKQVNKLSGGQKQRVAIARAIVNEP
jgi:putative ABC transport system ATP-binding protein